jgi:hypothetical protein
VIFYSYVSLPEGSRENFGTGTGSLMFESSSENHCQILPLPPFLSLRKRLGLRLGLPWFIVH